MVLYHVNPAWLPGGFLGVDVFFVLSGYLITDLLLAEHRRCGRIDLRDFWVRRARRLLPALALVLALVLLTATCAATVLRPHRLVEPRPECGREGVQVVRHATISDALVPVLAGVPWNRSSGACRSDGRRG
ncbi:acyltransferase family protein [Streptomyces yunnanensis]|uniref:Acyltransferase family protein n=1 Tax=Streptomyces yunnanensis TaxID=156453 RepID=A0A9X8QSU2_9ACTN|nr:acyltransferase family protein [Streptomyces yunnanensis]SHL84619.1 Acyltransferase family protein [Streptomyces yunnanensis]